MKLSFNGSLIARIKNGEKDAMEYIHSTYYPTLLVFAERIIKSNSSSAEDIVAEAFFKFWHNRNTLDNNTNIRAYIYKIVRNDCLNELKRAERLRNYMPEAANNYRDTLETDDQAKLEHRTELMQAILDEIETLSKKQKEIFVLHYVKGMDKKEIAGKLNISLSAVYTQIDRANDKLRNQMHKKGMLPLYLYWIMYSAGFATMPSS